MKPEVVKISDVWVQFKEKTVLKEQNLTVYKEDFLGIIGPNGGGKTTLLKVILGLVQPFRGQVKVFGRNPVSVRKSIGYVPQLSFFDHDFPISVMDVVLMGRLSKRPIFRQFTKQDYQAVLQALERTEVLHLKDRRIGELSGGERQRVFIARALVGNPKLLLLDEPTSSVDIQIKTGLYQLMYELKKDMTIILVTHDMGVISSHVDKIACLNCQLFYHDNKEISKETLEAVYKCPVDMIAHGVPHRVLDRHKKEEG
jgi:zinc transport system ATP-binding protein